MINIFFKGCRIINNIIHSKSCRIINIPHSSGCTMINISPTSPLLNVHFCNIMMNIIHNSQINLYGKNICISLQNASPWKHGNVTGYMRRYRYCEYLGKFFCPRCHSNELAFIPARILHRWDFTRYYVSNFARDLLERMRDDPLYNIDDINPTLYQRIRALSRAEEYRIQLYHLIAFLSTCRTVQR